MFYIILLFIAGSVVITGLSIAPYMPARKDALSRINKLAALQPGQTFYDLGCGDGRVCYYIAKNNPKAHVIGIELFFPMYLWSKIQNYFLKYQNIKIKFGNALKTDLSDADVIYVYGVKNTINTQLKKKFQKELKKGAKALSYIFSIKEWDGRVTLNNEGNRKAPIYVYERS